jgi:hypothetical protein
MKNAEECSGGAEIGREGNAQILLSSLILSHLRLCAPHQHDSAPLVNTREKTS